MQLLHCSRINRSRIRVLNAMQTQASSDLFSHTPKTHINILACIQMLLI